MCSQSSLFLVQRPHGSVDENVLNRSTGDFVVLQYTELSLLLFQRYNIDAEHSRSDASCCAFVCSICRDEVVQSNTCFVFSVYYLLTSTHLDACLEHSDFCLVVALA